MLIMISSEAHSDSEPGFLPEILGAFSARWHDHPDDEEAERPPWWLSAVSTFKIKYVVILMAAAAFIWRYRQGVL
jgi:hypothetical protein